MATRIDPASFARRLRTPLVLLASCALALSACGESAPICQNDVIREAVSPDGAMKATLFHRVCGGPTGAASQVSITAANEIAEGKGNAFIAATAGDAVPAAAWGGPDVALEWTSPRDLTLSYPLRTRIIVGESVVRGVNISHKSGD